MTKTIKNTLQSAKTIAIFGHEYVDGDCLGAMLGLGAVLEAEKKTVSYFTPYPVGKSLQFVKQRERIQTEFDYGSYDVLIFLDFTPYNRIKKFTQGHESYFDNNTLIIIDHHHGNHPSSTDLIIKDININSTCELLYEHIQTRRPQHITKETATYFYIGLTTDSGNFLYEKDTERIMKNALGLIQSGADKKDILDHIYYRNTLDMIKFSNTLIQRTQEDAGIIRTYYDDNEIENLDMDKDQADFGFYILRTIHGPKIYIRIRKTATILKGSVRGNGNINCAKLCEELFTGGGHHNAAGFSLERSNDFPSGIDYIIEKIQIYIQKL